VNFPPSIKRFYLHTHHTSLRIYSKHIAMAEERAALKKAVADATPSTTDFSSAARAFTEPTKQTFLEGKAVESQLSVAWDAFIAVVADTVAESQDPLVEILRTVQKENLSAERKCEIWGQEVKLWEDLPLFGVQWREVWNKAPGSGSKNDFSSEQWKNLNAFLARITAISASNPALDFSLYAIWTIRSAVEEGDIEQDKIAAAEVWFVYAGERLENLSKENKVFDGKIAKPGSKYQEKEWKGFSEERYKIWKDALQ